MCEGRTLSPLMLMGLASASLVLGCGTGSGGAAGGGGDGAAADGVGDDGAADGGGRGDRMSPGEPALEERIDEAAKSIQSDTCFAQADTSQCQWADYEVGPAQFNMARSTGEAILVIDDFGAGLFPQFVRYRNS